MNNLIYFFFLEKYSKFLGKIIKFILRFKNIRIGKNFSAFKFPLIIIEKNSEIYLGDNVSFFGEVELRATKNSKIKIMNNVKLDKFVRILSTNNSLLKIENNTKIGAFSILNGGDNLFIGENCLLSSNVQIQCSSHNFKRERKIQEQGFTHKEIFIGNDVWIGTKSTLLVGSRIKDKAIIGANSVVNSLVEENSIVAGLPAKFIKKRD